MKYTARQIKNWDVDTERNGKCVPARPLNHKYESWKSRIKNAFLVLIGKYDALDWEME